MYPATVLIVCILGILAEVAYGGNYVPFLSSPSSSRNRDQDNLKVRMYFERICEDRLNEQIGEELKASHVYLSMAHYFSRADVALYGFHKFFKKMSEEERKHGEILMEYINKRGGTVRMTSTLAFSYGEKLSSGDWVSAMEAMETAMKMEHHVNKNLVERVHNCHDDPHLQDFIEGTFLTEQVDSIKQIGDYLSKMKRLGEGVGLHMFDALLVEEK